MLNKALCTLSNLVIKAIEKQGDLAITKNNSGFTL
jgi:hypothetical protein